LEKWIDPKENAPQQNHFATPVRGHEQHSISMPPRRLLL
jgi:hypothetical protein